MKTHQTIALPLVKLDYSSTYSDIGNRVVCKNVQSVFVDAEHRFDGEKKQIKTVKLLIFCNNCMSNHTPWTNSVKIDDYRYVCYKFSWTALLIVREKCVYCAK